MAEKFSFFGALKKVGESPITKAAKEKAAEGLKKANVSLDKPAPQMTRRQMLGGALAMGVAGAVLKDSFDGGITNPEETESEKPKEGEAFDASPVEREKNEPGLYDMGPLAGRKGGGLFAYYLGLPEGSEIPAKLNINFDQVLENLWSKKIDFVSKRKPGILPNIKRARDQYLDMYKKRSGDTEMNLKELVDRAQKVADTLYGTFGWEDLSMVHSVESDFRTLTESDVDLVKTMAQVVSGKTLIAYSVTELMPSLNDAEMNVDMYEFLLTSAGVEFLSAVPAIYDVKLSVGPAQFTEYAVYDMGGSNQRGASVMNKLVPEEAQIGGSVNKLVTIDDHLKASYLFAIYNLTRLVKYIRNHDKAEKRMDTLRDSIKERPVAVLQFIASAHNNPGDGIQSFISWIDDDFAGSHAKRARHTEGYIKKSNINYKELDRRV